MKKIKDFKSYLKGVSKISKINSGKSFYLDGQDVCKLASDIIEFMESQGISYGEDLPTITFTKIDQEEKIPVFKATGSYAPASNTIEIHTKGRALKDCLRSLTHELIHADQKINKGLDIEKASDGIYGKDEDVEYIESDAYERGNMMFRKWEESLRGKI